MKFEKLIILIKNLFQAEEKIHLHLPYFLGNEKQYVNEAIEGRRVSAFGPHLDRLEILLKKRLNIEHTVLTNTGTSALHLGLKLLGVEKNTEVLTQALTFVATPNAIHYCGAIPNFVDVDKDTLGLSPSALKKYLKEIVVFKDGKPFNKETGRRISACLPVHVLGFPARIDEIAVICKEYHIPLIEDAAEALGSSYKGKELGTYGDIGVFSFNGNKIVTGGSGGVLVTNNELYASRAKHLSRTAKVPSLTAYYHDELGYNYPMTNLTGALLLAQLEQLDIFIKRKHQLFQEYQNIIQEVAQVNIIEAPKDAEVNYWLLALLFEDESNRDLFLKELTDSGIEVRAIWKLVSTFPMYKDAPKAELPNSEWLAKRIANIPSNIQ